MSLFSTEFLLHDDVGYADFMMQTLSWVQGIRNSRVLSGEAEAVEDGDNITYRAGSGETLMLRALRKEGVHVAFGCRHDLPDDQGRAWRTEAVLRRTAEGNLLRVRAQCLATQPLARTETPKRTHLIRDLIEKGRVLPDGPLPIQTVPHRLDSGEESLELATAITEGTAPLGLPVVYVSLRDETGAALTSAQLERMARDLCGIAHVVVEPSRTFSLALRHRTGGRNVYGGTIGLSVPGRGIVRRLHLGPSYPDSATLAAEVQRAATELRTGLPSRGGWEWHDLQEQVLADQRSKERSRLTDDEAKALMAAEVAEVEALFAAGLAAKDDRIRELTARISALQDENEALSEALDRQSGLPDLGMAEIYPGEMADRLRAAARAALEQGRDKGWDERSLAVFRVLAARPVSQGYRDLRDDLREATADPKKMDKTVQRLLEFHGYVFKSNNGHPKMVPAEGFPGLGSVTLANTPGDVRAGKNQKSEIEGAMGLKVLD